jgi:hypothetical protein
MDGCSIPNKGNIFPPLKHSKPALGPSRPLFMVTSAITPGVNLVGRETNHSYLSSADIKNA